MQAVPHETRLIPPPFAVRVELARNVREGRRLRALLRLSMQAIEDRRFLDDLVGAPVATRAESDGPGEAP